MFIYKYRYAYTNVQCKVASHNVSLIQTHTIDLPRILPGAFCGLLLTEHTITADYFTYLLTSRSLQINLL